VAVCVVSFIQHWWWWWWWWNQHEIRSNLPKSADYEL